MVAEHGQLLGLKAKLPQHCGIPYSGKYWQDIKFGGLAVFRKSAKLKPANISGYYIHTQYSIMSIRSSTLQLITHMHCSQSQDGAVEVRRERRTCAQVWCSLKTGDRTREQTREASSCAWWASEGRHEALCDSRLFRATRLKRERR